MNWRNVLIVLASLIGAVLIIVGAVLGFSVLPDYVHDEIAKQVRLENGTEQYERWEELPFPLAFKVYLFEVTNPQDVLTGAKPNVQERGPYVYDLRRSKFDISGNEKLDTLTYRQLQQYEFNKDLSGKNDEEDEFYVLNAPLLGTIQTFEVFGILGMIDSIWEGAYEEHKANMIGPFIKIKVREYLFEGFEFCSDQSNDMCALMKGSISDIKTLELTKDGKISFAFFRFKNNTDDGEYTINAGMDIVENIGNIKSWEGATKLEIWAPDGTCNDIGGRDSTIYPPYIEKEDTFHVFNTDICRVVTLEYYDQEEYKDIEGQRRHLRKDTFDNTGDNSCFCAKFIANLNGSRAECLPNGFVDLNPCLASPVVLSYPHFLGADKDIADTVTGLLPNEDAHVTFVVVEPGTGYPLRGAKRVQFNMVLRPYKGLTMAKDLPQAMVPLVWVEEGVNLPDNLVDEINDKYLSKLVLVDAVTWTLIAVGIAMFLGFGVWFLFKKK